jgi:putative flippase GtrA
VAPGVFPCDLGHVAGTMVAMSQTLSQTASKSVVAVETQAVKVDSEPQLADVADGVLPASNRPDSSQEGSPVVEVAIPVYNEALILEQSIRTLRSYLDESFPFQTTIRIVDNASTDGTWAIATQLAEAHPGVSALHLDEKGKGRAVRAAWSSSSAEIVCYMDVDLSTDLGGLLPLVAPLLSGHSDVSVGSRYARGAHVLRGARRELVSSVYNVLLRGALRPGFSDSTCGFKAATRETAELLLPSVHDDRWFFDTEFLVVAERNGFRINEVPVDWVDDADSRVDVAGVAWEDLRGVARLIRDRTIRQDRIPLCSRTGNHLHTSQATRYAGVGVLSTLAYLTIFLLLRERLGIYAANVVAVGASTIGSTVAHVVFTFGPNSGLRMRQAAKAGGLGFLTGIALTTGVLMLENAAGVSSVSSQILAILIGITASAFVRFLLLRSWAYRTHTRGRAADVAIPDATFG